ncbi:Kinesin-related protein 11 [Glycine soja]|uniref:Kinesin-related protein 11 n=1 Tax=Glycine soja TaxID=3848 RepID=A0A0B2QF09_GLYSO|nr:Kinesin-related protein 11 [Glycine soja]
MVSKFHDDPTVDESRIVVLLGQVIAKLTDENATHIPYRDSKLTRLLQSSLSGHGRIFLICTVTPASSSSEETRNTLKFAHRSKHVEIKASQNKIMDEKSLIKKYQKEISELKQELQQLKHGMVENPNMATSSQEDLANLKLQLEAGQSKLKSRLQEEEQAKAALMGRIQRLTKLILVSTKNVMSSSIPERPSHRRRHSFGEDELAYLPDRKRETWINDDAGSHASVPSPEEKDDITNLDELGKDYRRSKRRGMLGWLKLRNGSPASASKLTPNRVMVYDMKDSRRNSVSRKDNASALNSFPGRTQAGDLLSVTVGGRQLPPTGTTVTDQMDLLREQVKMLAGEDMHKLKGEISQKKNQIRILEQRMIGSIGPAPRNCEMSQALSKLTTELNEKIFELEIKSADNRILQEQLQLKNSENIEMQETIISLTKQINLLLDKTSTNHQHVADNETNCSRDILGKNDEAQSLKNLNALVSQSHPKQGSNDSITNSQILVQAAEIENLRQENVRLVEKKVFNEMGNQKSWGMKFLIEELQKDLNARLQREAALEAALSVKVEIEADLRSTLDEIKHQKQDLEYELTNMRMLVSKMKKSGINVEDKSTVYVPNDVQTKAKNGHPTSNGYSHRKQYQEGEILESMDMIALEELRANYQRERRCKELESHISILKVSHSHDHISYFIYVP